MSEQSDWLRDPDLASRRAGGGVVWANDEFFAERENLIKPEVPVFQPWNFGPKGQVYDGWETRRRREPGNDQAIVRLGLRGVISGVVIDTAFFTGNYPSSASVEACAVDGYPAPEELADADWQTVLPATALAGDTANAFAVHNDRRYTHVRLTIYPDGGVARFRVHGRPVADPRFLGGDAFDLAALGNGGTVTGCSNMFYSSPANLLAPGFAAVMGEGWETARRRDDGNDWVGVALAAPGVVRIAELDTTHFKGNAPGWAMLTGQRAGTGEQVELLGHTRLQPDTRHRFRIPGPPVEVEHVRLDVFPDGGMSRLRLFGTVTETGREALVRRWFDALPDSHARAVLDGVSKPAEVEELLTVRPLPPGPLPEPLLRALAS